MCYDVRCIVEFNQSSWVCVCVCVEWPENRTWWGKLLSSSIGLSLMSCDWHMSAGILWHLLWEVPQQRIQAQDNRLAIIHSKFLVLTHYLIPAYSSSGLFLCALWPHSHSWTWYEGRQCFVLWRPYTRGVKKLFSFSYLFILCKLCKQNVDI